ncbi:ABC transporter permease subunit [Actinoallomurus sp. NPDC052308]|uniref:ABC transporter permease subunit n=1 Tax=Actinoallomurus sp. NPDC052308 TaxID=3155530 RepID=UPI0034454BDD
MTFARSFARLSYAEWTKFRTVRGWVLGIAVAALVTVGLGLFSASGSHSSCGGPDDVCPAVPIGPDGEAVDDKFYFVHRALDGDGSITVRVSSMTGQVRLPDATPGVRRVASKVEPWAKAGVMIKDGTRQGAAYAALMVTGGHGVRMQHDFTHDTAGSRSGVSKAAPRWLRLTRAGDELTGYESADGTRWVKVGTARLAGLPSTVRVGLFAASPGDLTVTQADLGGAVAASRFAQATAIFDHVGLQGGTSDGSWRHDDIGAAKEPDGAIHHPGGAVQAGGTFTVTGVGDIAPRTDGQTVEKTLSGLLAGLIVVIVVAVVFVTAEYRRGLIRTTLLAGPRRGRTLTAKAVVIAAVTFVAGLAAAGVTVPLGTHILRANGNYILPVGSLTELRVVAGTAALLAVAAVLALALGTVFRRSAVAITGAIALVILPRILATTSVLPVEASRWLLRVTPAAGFAIEQSIPAYPQVTAFYSPQAGYYPLAPWAGFAVSCGYAALALGLAVLVLRRRDA